MKTIRERDVFGDHYSSEVCVVGGGMAGLCAAIASARSGAKTVLIHDRPVLGGNASSEVRMWICGAHGKHNKETGILEELQLENQYRNAGKDFSIWDSVLWGHAAHQPNLTLLLNTSVTDARMEDGHVAEVTAWQLTSQTWFRVQASQFIDCSGDSILAALTGAEHRIGREPRDLHGEHIAPTEGDEHTMGNSLLIQLHKTKEAQSFTPPDWAYRFNGPEDLPNRLRGVSGHNFWWIELGGIQDTLRDAEAIRDDLYRTAYGVWDYIKNRAPERDKAANWSLHFLGSLPGKRENRRIVGDHILTQHDLEAGGNFADIVAYGGWSMDDHHPAGMLYPGNPTIFHPAPSPYGIPFRCLYSKTVPNLLCAGRNISATHSAMSSTRVMATCALMGQAAGTAAALCIRYGCSPRSLSEQHVPELQRTLQNDDVWLPGRLRKPDLRWFDARMDAEGEGVETLLDGWERDREGENHGWTCEAGGAVTFTWREMQSLPGLRLVLDSDLCNAKKMACEYPQVPRPHAMPGQLVRDLSIEVDAGNGEWECVLEIRDNRKRLLELPIPVKGEGVRIRLERSWGEADPRLFSVDVLEKGRDDTVQFPVGNHWQDVVAAVPPEDLKDPEIKSDARGRPLHGA